VDFNATGQNLILHSALVKYFRIKWEYNEAMLQLFIESEKAFDSVRREGFCNILMEFCNHMNLVKLINSYSRVRVCKYLSDMIPISNGSKQGDALSHLL
jgi:hypothetical protein